MFARMSRNGLPVDIDRSLSFMFTVSTTFLICGYFKCVHAWDTCSDVFTKMTRETNFHVHKNSSTVNWWAFVWRQKSWSKSVADHKKSFLFGIAETDENWHTYWCLAKRQEKQLVLFYVRCKIPFRIWATRTCSATATSSHTSTRSAACATSPRRHRLATTSDHTPAGVSLFHTSHINRGQHG